MSKRDSYSLADTMLSVDVSASLLSLSIGGDFWLALARYVARKVFQITTDTIVRFSQAREEIKIQAEASKARVRTSSLIAVAEIYEQGKRNAGINPLLPEDTKAKVINSINMAMDNHFARIISVY